MSNEFESTNQSNNMDIEQSNSDSAYSFRSVKFLCQHCQRIFSALNPENGQANCPRCGGTSRIPVREQPRSQPQVQENQQRTQSQAQAQPRAQQPINGQQSQNAPEQNAVPLHFNIIRQTIFTPGQTIFIETVSPSVGVQQPQPQQNPQQQQQQANAQQQTHSGLFAGLESLFGVQDMFSNLLEGLFHPQRPQAQAQNPFGSNPADLFGEQPQPQPQAEDHHHRAVPQGFLFNPFMLSLSPFDLFTPRRSFFTAADYERMVEEFLRNDPNQYGPAPASQESLNKLHEFQYEPGKCKHTSCAVCQEDFNKGDNAVSLPCGHVYHKDCVTQWLKLHDACPVCRQPISQQGEKSQNHTAQRDNNVIIEEELPRMQ